MIEFRTLASSSKGNAYLLNDGKTPLLVECGISIKKIKQAMDYKLSKVLGCLLTHEHFDHSKAANDLMRVGVDIYSGIGTLRALDITKSHRAHAIMAKRQFTIGTWTILPFDTVHDCAEPLGFLLASGKEKLLFATDTAYIKYRFNGLTQIAIECNYDLDIVHENVESGSVPYALKKRLMRSHLGVKNVKDFLDANDLSKVKAIYLLHLSDSNSDEQKFIKELQAMNGVPVYACGA